MNKTGLSENDFLNAAKELNCEVAAIKAVVKVESNGRGFHSDGRMRILFEAHWFDKLTKGAFRKSHPHISSRRWNRSLYKYGKKEHDRLQQAMNLDFDAALQSASYGLFQVMGFHWKAMGFDSPAEFVDFMGKGEKNQLKIFIKWIQKKKLDRFLRSRDWAAFAYRYNGAGYKKNRYDMKMAEAYRSFSKGK